MSIAAKHILFVTLSNIGDVVLTLPVMDRLKQIFPGCRITVVVSPRARDIFAQDASVEQVIVYDKHAPLREKFALLKKLSAGRFDAVIDLRNSLFGYLVPARLKSRKAYRLARSAHMKERHLAAVSHFPHQTHEPRPGCLNSSAEEIAGVQRLLAGYGVNAGEKPVLLSAGARSLTKRWPKEHFAELARRLIKELRVRVILVGDSADVENNRGIAAACNGVIDLTGKTTLRELIALVRIAELIITNDSATLHLASYLDRSVLALFGPTDEVRYGPWSRRKQAIFKHIACRPCQQALCRFGHCYCLTSIRPDAVFQAARRFLTQPGLPVGALPGEDAVRRILIVRTDKLGDVILSTPVFQALREAYPRAYLVLLVRPYTFPAVKHNPFIDEIIPYDKAGIGRSWWKTLGMVRVLRQHRFDLAVILHPSIRNHLLTFLAGIPHRVGYSGKGSFLLTDTLENSKHLGKKHEIDYNLDLIRSLGIEPQRPALFLGIGAGEREWAAQALDQAHILPADRLVILHPGTNDPSRTWLPQRYAAVADAVIQRWGCKVMVFSGETDRAIAEQVLKEMRAPAVNMIARATIMQEAAVLQRAAVFISTDTGPMHIASALGVPVVALFGRRDPGVGPLRWGPVSPRSRVVQKDPGCPQCFAHRCTRGFRCLQAIEVQDVLQAVEAVLNGVERAQS
ncbi:MAG TPA: lipopolysaccharide heptosyltransferase II [Candidatus Omnitrophota bacterium]|nr:lipopolysaccharide heptosyltransferase II [Candidatus Omnitrophota bacterium]HRZ14587.1 lipopolysaccharide heptosyltransferase II [Candidatus Omnitrophota bacterium]